MDIFILILLTLPIYAIVFGIRRLRHSSKSSVIGAKTAPLGCLATIGIPLALFSIILIFDYRLPDWVGITIFIVSFIIGIFVIISMTAFFYRKALAWQQAHIVKSADDHPEEKTHPGYGILFFLLLGIIFTPLNFIAGFYVEDSFLYSYKDKLELPASSNISDQIFLKERKIRALPTETSFMLIVKHRDGTSSEFPDFLINCGGGRKIAVYHIPGESAQHQGSLVFVNSEATKIPSCFDLDTRQFKDDPHSFSKEATWVGAPHQFLGLYHNGNFDTKASDPEWFPEPEKD